MADFFHRRRLLVLESLVAAACLSALPQKAFSEVIVTGKNRNAKSAVTSIGADDLQADGPDIDDALAGLRNGSLPGTVLSGRPGGDIRVRGARDLGGVGGETLVLVNGSRTYGGTGNIDIGAIPPASIKSIDVLRGPSAVTLYGREGANGVILITLKDDAPAPADRSAGSTGTTGTDDPYGLLGGSSFNPFMTNGDVIPDEFAPAVGISNYFANSFSGAVDANSLCDFGDGSALLGRFLFPSPWVNGLDYEKRGDDVLIPLNPEPSSAGAADSPPTDSAADDAPAGGSDGSNANGAPEGSEAEGVSAESTGGGMPASANAPPSKPAPTALQQWDRGVPPWSLVLNSPEVAHLVEQLQPYYDLRFDTRAQMAELGFWQLSDAELADNKADYDAARDTWKGTRREILTILGPYMNPAVAAAAATGDPSWADGPGPVLDAGIFGEPVAHPSVTATSPPPAATQSGSVTPGNPEENELFVPRLDVKINTLYGGFSGFQEYSTFADAGYRELMEEFFSRIPVGGVRQYAPGSIPDAELIERIQQDFSDNERLGGNPILEPEQVNYQKILDVVEMWGIDVYLTDPFWDDSNFDNFDGVPRGGVTPAAGAVFQPSFSYEAELPLPFSGQYKDPQFNSDLGSQRGFGDQTGRLQYGDTAYDVDSVLAQTFRYDALRRGASRPGFDSLRTGYEGGTIDYDTRTVWRDGIQRIISASQKGDFDPVMPRYADLFNDVGTQRGSGSFDFDPTKFRLGYNLKEGTGAISIPVGQYEAETYKTNSDSAAFLDMLGEAGRNDLAADYMGSWKVGQNYYHNFRHPDLGIDFDWRKKYFSVPKANVESENDFCATEAFPVGAALQATIDAADVDDDWFLRRTGFSNANADKGAEIVVAVIDTGLDYHHYDFNWRNIWRNAGEVPDNGVDDDDNGFVDDIIGWDFTAQTNTPWDHDGHGTFVAGLIAADSNNRVGIDGINSSARIMVLKALNGFGHTRASALAQAIIYATDNGARIINLSAAGPGLPQFVQDAVDYADSKGVLIFVAAGNTAENVDGIGPAGLDNVVTVAATGFDDSRASFSNWGNRIDLAAPGIHIKSLRARETDFRITSLDTPYKRGTAILGGDRRYYRADGTSFAAPLVAGAASLIWSQNPELSHTQVRRMLEHSARDIDTPGRDQYTGYGLLDAAAALRADPEFYVDADIAGVVAAVVDGQQVARVTGTADASEFSRAVLEIGAGESPTEWRRVGKGLKQPVNDGLLGDIPAQWLQGSAIWTVRIITEHKDDGLREGRFRLNIGG